MKRAELRKLRIETSVKNRVLCPLTSLLVLESESDYRRFNIDRSAMPEILEVAPTGIQLRKRGPDDLPPLASKSLPMKTKKPAERTEGLKEAKALADQDDDKAARPGSVEQSFGNRLHEEGYIRESLARSVRSRDAYFDGAEKAEKEVEFSLAVDAIEAPHPTAEYATGRGLSPVPTGGTLRSEPRQQAQAASAAATPPAAHPFANNGALNVEARGSSASNPVTVQALSANAGTTNAFIAVGGNADWTAQGIELPSDAQLSELRARVQASPLDRKLRNDYADSLARAAKWDNLQAEVFQWLPFDPENPAVYEYLGKSATGLNDAGLMALRAYSSIAVKSPPTAPRC